ncbi:MAG: DUF551 domain-containing protein [Lachnospiraceae bacterium]|nr:DUF551 domain-containing protein [Lachnospiraceae bacterium]
MTDGNKKVDRSAVGYYGGWIPCSERMPETGIPVLCQWHKRNGLDTEVYFSILHVDDDGKWVADYGMPNGEVVAWMPLPEPYEGGMTE